MTPEQLAALINVPGMLALVFIIIRQQRQIDALQQANTDLIKQFMTLHPPQDAPAPKTAL